MSLAGGSLTVSTSVKAVGKLAGSGNTAANTIPTVSRSITGGTSEVISFGSGSGNGDLVCCGEYSIDESSSITIDLYSGGTTTSDLTDVFGGAAPFRIIRSLVVEITSGGDASGVRIGGAASNEWTGYFASAGDQVDIFPSGVPFAVSSPAGKTVGSTTKNLKIANLSTAAAVVVRVTAGGSRYQAGEWMGFWGFMTNP